MPNLFNQPWRGSLMGQQAPVPSFGGGDWRQALQVPSGENYFTPQRPPPQASPFTQPGAAPPPTPQQGQDPYAGYHLLYDRPYGNVKGTGIKPPMVQLNEADLPSLQYGSVGQVRRDPASGDGVNYVLPPSAGHMPPPNTAQGWGNYFDPFYDAMRGSPMPFGTPPEDAPYYQWDVHGQLQPTTQEYWKHLWETAGKQLPKLAQQHLEQEQAGE